jgi:hypothetical protein
MSKFTDYIDGFADKSSTLAKDELKELILSAKKDESEFVGIQAENVERWTVMLAAGEFTPFEKGKQMILSAVIIIHLQIGKDTTLLTLENLFSNGVNSRGL